MPRAAASTTSSCGSRTCRPGSTCSTRAPPIRSRRTPRTSCTTSSPGRAHGHASGRDAAGRARVRWCSSRRGGPHRFHDIAERLELLVVFGPAEGARALTPLDLTAGGRRSSTARTTARERQRELGAAADLVVAEEHEHVVAGGQERLEPGRPGRELVGRRSRGGAAGGTGTARSGGASAARCRRAARSRTAPRRRRPARRTSRRRATTGPGTPSSAAGRRATRRASPPACRRRAGRRRERGTGRSRAAHRTPRYGPVSHGTAVGRIDLERAERAAALGLDREPEVGRRGGDPGRDLRRPTARRSRCCSARPPAAAPRSAPGSPDAGEPGGVEPRRPSPGRRTRSSRRTAGPATASVSGRRRRPARSRRRRPAHSLATRPGPGLRAVRRPSSSAPSPRGPPGRRRRGNAR